VYSAFRWIGSAFILGDTDNTPYGGGTWASRAPASAVRRAAGCKGLRKNILDVAAAILQSTPGELEIVKTSGERRDGAARSS